MEGRTVDQIIRGGIVGRGVGRAQAASVPSGRQADRSRPQKPRNTARGRHAARRRIRRRSSAAGICYSPRHAALSRANRPLPFRAASGLSQYLGAAASLRCARLTPGLFSGLLGRGELRLQGRDPVPKRIGAGALGVPAASARSARPTKASACFSARTTSVHNASTCSFSRCARCRSSANARSASARATTISAFNSSICTRSAFALARSRDQIGISGRLRWNPSGKRFGGWGHGCWVYAPLGWGHVNLDKRRALIRPPTLPFSIIQKRVNRLDQQLLVGPPLPHAIHLQPLIARRI